MVSPAENTTSPDTEQEAIKRQEESRRTDENRTQEQKRQDENRRAEENRVQEQRWQDENRRVEQNRAQEQRRADERRRAEQKPQQGQEVQATAQEKREEPKQAQRENAPQSQELRDLARIQAGFEAQIRVQSQVNVENAQTIEKYNDLKAKTDMLDKLNHSIATTKDKGLLEKYQANRQGIESEIGRVHGIYKAPSKPFQSREKTKNQEQAYRGKIGEQLQNFEVRAAEAAKSLAEAKGGARRDTDYKTNSRQQARTPVQTDINIQTQTPVQSRNR